MDYAYRLSLYHIITKNYDKTEIFMYFRLFRNIDNIAESAYTDFGKNTWLLPRPKTFFA